MERLPPPESDQRFSFGPRANRVLSGAGAPSQLIFDQRVLMKRARVTDPEDDNKRRRQGEPQREANGPGESGGEHPDVRNEEEEEEKEKEEEEKKEQKKQMPTELTAVELAQYLHDHIVPWPVLRCHLQSGGSSRTLEYTLEVLNSLFSPPSTSAAPMVSLLPSSLVVNLLRELLLSPLCTLTSSPDRSLLSCLFLVAGQKPALATQGVILPLLFSPSAAEPEGPGPVQLDLVHRLLKDGMGEDDAADALLLFLRTEQALLNKASPPTLPSPNPGMGWTLPKWGEALLELFLGRASSKGPASPELWSLLRHSLSERCPAALYSSKKLGTLLFTLASKRGAEIAGELSEWKSLVEKTETFLKKATLTALNKH